MTTGNKVLIGVFGVVVLGGIVATVVILKKKPATTPQVSTTTTTSDTTQHGGIGSTLSKLLPFAATGESNFLGYNIQTA